MKLVAAERLDYEDPLAGLITLPSGPLRIHLSFGSGLAPARGEEGLFWAVGDRGPNLKIETLVDRYGASHLADLGDLEGAKVMPRLDIGPAVARLRVHEDRVELLEHFPLTGDDGAPLSGLPVPEHGPYRCEPVFDLEGRPLDHDPNGFDTEAIAVAPDGSLWLADEFGPSLVRADGSGRVFERFVPAGLALPGARYAVSDALPRILQHRQLNRGFEGLAFSADGAALYAILQSPLAHPSAAAGHEADHLRLFEFDPATMRVAAQYLYPLDPPSAFARDAAAGKVRRRDRKVSELAWIGPGTLLVLERVSRSTKLYRVRLDRTLALPPAHLDPATRPTVEEQAGGVRFLVKTLLLDTDRHPELPADLEGMALLAPDRLLLSNDSDFGVEGATTQFWRLDFSEDLDRGENRAAASR